MRTAIAIDFDGTLCFQDAPYPEIGSPRLAVIEAAKRRRAAGCGLILWTCREGKPLEQAIQWCHKYGLDFDAVNDSLPDWKEAYGTNPRKIGATEYWDDKSVTPTAIENKKGEKYGKLLLHDAHQLLSRCDLFLYKSEKMKKRQESSDF